MSFMRNTILISFFLLSLLPYVGFSQGEPFSAKKILNQLPSNAVDRYFLLHPFEIIYGPDDSLWISERRGRVSKVDPVTGIKRTVLDIKSNVKFTTNGPPVTSVSQDGMMGMAIHPDYPAVDSFFIAYVYDAGSGVRKVRIAEYPVKDIAITSPTGNEKLITKRPEGSEGV